VNPLRYLQLVLVLLLVGAGGYGVRSYRHLAAKAATADTRIAEAEAGQAALQRQFDTLSQEVVRRAEFDRAIRETRATISRNLDTATREDPESAGYLGQPIPQRVRDAYVAPAPQR
jgi:hypothetical protein